MAKAAEQREVGSWYIGVSAEAFAAAQFARFGINVSVQYGANQPEYDLLISQGDYMLKVSVKGSQDGSWGLTQGFMKDKDYHAAIDNWLKAHGEKTIFCLVQFKDVKSDELPRMYLATPKEIAEEMKKSRAGYGDTVLREYKEWTSKSIAAGTVDEIPKEWVFDKKRAEELLKSIG
ncbi:MAG: hypothetical protein IKP88_00715 [Lachnospiraceae bacterium]|nr:hypothetical protein [Lachnospiraceae bacterium]